MGTDTPIAALSEPAAAAVRLLHPAVRAGHQPAAGRDPRGARHLAVDDDRAGAQPARPDAGLLPADHAAVPGHRQRRARQDHPRQRRRRPAGLRLRRSCKGLYPVAGGGDGAARRARAGAAGGQRRDRGRRAADRAVRPRRRRRAGADPVAAADQRGAPPPDPREDPHQGRPDRRGRRRARGAPRRAADRLRRGGGQPVPRDGVGRGPGPSRRRRRRRRRTRRCTTTSRRSARACSR